MTAYITGEFASWIIGRGKHVMKNEASKGYLIIGWNNRAELLVRQLVHGFDAGQPRVPIAVLTKKPVKDVTYYEDRGIIFSPGGLYSDDDLEKVGAKKANSIILVSVDREKDKNPDLETISQVLKLTKFLNRTKWGIYLTQVAPRCSMRCDGGLSAELG